MIASGVDRCIRDDVIAECDTLIADIPVRSRNNFRDLVWRLATKRAGNSTILWSAIIHLPYSSATDCT
jgi:hypothetical protein